MTKTFDKAATIAELSHWFFDIYFNHWIEVGNGVRDEGPEFVLLYWGTPMYVTVDEPEMATWLLSDEEIVDFLVMQHEQLRAAGYTHTVVPDKKITAFNSCGGAIEVIWSRRAADESEIHRYAVKFDVAKFKGTWKVVGVQGRATNVKKDQNTLELAWQ